MADNTNLPELSSIPPGVDIKPDNAAIADTGAALDALFKPIDQPPGQAPGSADPSPAPTTATPPVTPTPAAGALPGTTGAATPPGTPGTAVPPGTPSAPGTSVTPPVTPDPVKDEFDAVQLPPHTKSEVAQSFDTLKKTSRERVAAAQKERDELSAKVKELETRPAVDPKLEAELKELREFRQKMDVEADPTFKEYVEEVNANDDLIWKKLKEAGANDEVLGKMKAIGTKELDWEVVLEKLPPVARRYIENKLAVNEDLNDRRARAIEDAKKNASEFLSERQKQSAQDELAHYSKAEDHFNKVSVQLPWFKLQKPDATTTAEQKAAMEAENKFFLHVQDHVAKILKDPSPEMRAVVAVGYAQMLRLQEEIPALQAEHESEKKTLTDKITALEAQVKEKDEFIARVKGASRTSLRDGGAPPNTGAATQPTFNEPGAVAIDRLRAQQVSGS